MISSMLNHPILWGGVVLLTDLLAWNLLHLRHRAAKIGVRLGLFLLYSVVIIEAGISPLEAPNWPDAGLFQFAATALAILWWIYLARVLTEILGLVLTRRIGHSGRLLQDVIGALVFLVAIVAAAGYVMQLPVKGLLATSGVMAIVIGLALQSTLSDVFSGIILNTTKPYQVDDLISIDGTEGKVVDIDWRSTRLLTSSGSTAIIPNSVAAKAKILNLSKPSDAHGVSISLFLPNHVRPRRVLDALERTLQGSRDLLAEPEPRAVLKAAGETSSEYVASGFISSLAKRGEVRNQLFDLAFRHLDAAGIGHQEGGNRSAVSRAREILEEVKIFRSLSEEEKDQLAQGMTAREYSAGQTVLAVGDMADGLMVIATGVVSAALAEGKEWVEAGRMGPGEVMGEQSILADSPSAARFTALTSCVVYLIDKQITRRCMEQRVTVGKALNKLQAVRTQNAESLLLHKPVAVSKGGFLSWLGKR
jgi:small-conductance mechanosensitive channel